MKEVVDELGKIMSIAMLHFSEVYPLPDLARFDYVAFLQKAKLPLCIALNITPPASLVGSCALKPVLCSRI